ncbi:hypothetical protein CEP54_008210 [Fusarium duplospermum]|uniref:Uncharacterized protein n=1 Tax=Fusarium duplospermum TaxID=1325734 RepID=A0A428PXA7_9HYPO|nr:hypothetical protein CEP54_008210 [Fusarium duplospermum]
MKTTFFALVSLSLSAVMALPANANTNTLLECTQHTHEGDAEYFCCPSALGGDVWALCGDECHLVDSTHSFNCDDTADQGWHCHAH